jgi:8-oxo-dGTP pyrophosphatase MutT (NUDIX family)/phosphohistidine phosphatase SixA
VPPVSDVQVEAAGGVLWRGDPSAPEVAVVHRPRYDDWSLPKGKLDVGEHPLLGALREIHEETGFAARPGRRLGSLRYVVAEGPKRVRYWACEAVEGAFTADREVDELRWLSVAEALAVLSPTHDRTVLERYAADTRRTRALVLVRHASAGDKKGWTGRDADRPLDLAGRGRAVLVASLLEAHAVRRLATADVVRCRDTFEPYARRARVALTVLPETTAGTFQQDPAAAVDAVGELLGSDGAAAWCGQREVIPDLAASLVARLGGTVDPDELRDLRKGALLLLHVDQADGKLVAVERLPG